MWYVKQIHNPNKHPLMPDDYPWIISSIGNMNNAIFINDADFDILVNSFDISAYEEAVNETYFHQKQREQREYGDYLSKEMTDLVGVVNLNLASQNIAVNIAQLGQTLSGLKLLMEGGALKTSRNLCNYYKTVPDLAPYISVFDHAIEDINEFLALRGYE